jgi:hypothetical protein
MTSSEIDHEGFHVRRSESETDNLIRLTNNLITSIGNTSSAHEYIYI